MTKHALPKLALLAMAAMVFIVTGCPHNDYTVQLKPNGAGMDRTLVFYRADGTNADGSTKYERFDTNEWANIVAFYHGQETASGERHTVTGTFTNALPADVGGAGAYTNLTTSLGGAGFYAERFRGNDDLAAMTEQRFKAADQLADVLVGWSAAELGKEAGYHRLHDFLNVDFRHDLKNASSYCWEGQVASGYQTNTTEEFFVRYGQYLYERGYFSLGEIPAMAADFSGSDPKAGYRWLQRLVARKLGVTDDAALPSSLNFMADDVAMEQSFTNYFVHTKEYSTRLAEWKQATQGQPDAKQPSPEDIAGEMFEQMLAFDFNIFGETPDHLTVQLSLPAPPLHSNGHWDEVAKQEVWTADLQSRTNLMRLPVSCFASWAQADEAFQTAHFGKVALTGDELMQYCFWRCGQDAKHAGEWDAFIAGLTPDQSLAAKLDAFHFSNDTNSVAFPGGLIKKGL